MTLVELMDEHFGRGNGKAIEAVLLTSPTILAEWMTERRIIQPAHVWRRTFPPTASGSRNGPASLPSVDYLFKDPAIEPPTVPRYSPPGTITRLFTVGGAK